MRRSKKRTPTIYLIFIFCLIGYGLIGNYVVSRMQDHELLHTLNSLNITITFFWFFFNIFLIVFFSKNGYEGASFVLAIYYVLLGLFNISNIIFRYLNNPEFHFWFSYGTKVLGGILALKLLIRNLRNKEHHRKL